MRERIDMKTILHITECLGSGVLNYIKNLSAWQIKEYNVVVAYSTRPETPVNFKDQFDPRVKFIYVEAFTREIEFNSDINAFFSIKKIVKDVEPNIVHLHSTKAGILGRWAINCNKYKVLYSPHAYSFLMMNCSEKKRKLYQFFEKISNRRNCLTIADVHGELEASHSVTKNAICIPNGINPSEMDSIIMQAKRYVEKFDKVTVCMLGKAVPQKNPSMFNEIAKHFPDLNFIWIGAGPLESELHCTNITVTGWLDRVHATAKILSSDIFLFPSVWESLSIALMEVMYIGKPCVVSNCDGNRDVINNHVNGYVCKEKNEYINAINELIADRRLMAQYGEAARQDIISIYNVIEMEKKYKELFSIIL